MLCGPLDGTKVAARSQGLQGCGHSHPHFPSSSLRQDLRLRDPARPRVWGRPAALLSPGTWLGFRGNTPDPRPRPRWVPLPHDATRLNPLKPLTCASSLDSATGKRERERAGRRVTSAFPEVNVWGHGARPAARFQGVEDSPLGKAVYLKEP